MNSNAQTLKLIHDAPGIVEEAKAKGWLRRAPRVLPPAEIESEGRAPQVPDEIAEPEGRFICWGAFELSNNRHLLGKAIETEICGEKFLFIAAINFAGKFVPVFVRGSELIGIRAMPEQEARETAQVGLGIDAIQRATAKYFGLKLEVMLSGSRSEYIAHARQVAMYLARLKGDWSYPEIAAAFPGKKIGQGKDHGTVLHAVETITAFLKTEARTKLAVTVLRRQLGI